MRRRDFITGSLAACCLARAPFSLAGPTRSPALEAVVASPWLANGVTVSPKGEIFLNFPRFKEHNTSPAVARQTAAGLVPFPGNHWNQWRPGDSGTDTLVNVNAVHIFSQPWLWVVDQGTPEGGKPGPGAAKVIAFNLESGEPEKIIRFNASILPEGGVLNDLRLFGNYVFITDSGLGGIIIYDLNTGKYKRKLSGSPLLKKPSQAQQKGFGGRVLSDGKGTLPAVQSDMLEISPNGQWLYVATPTGPLYRVPLALLLDEVLDGRALEQRMEKVADIPSIGGTAMDRKGRIYLSNVEERAIEVLHPNGRREILLQDNRLISPDALYIANDGFLYIPAPQLEYLAAHSGGRGDQTRAPYYIYRYLLPVRP
ncbi:L-dopachrome tautomerase-related protein [Nissabacter sp. SGAir0207]|uniref:L-dopachrome tautomerase-related protein n=1 Tax=Nissabacter sp. SGAir0207 TaxID=2126321 RepID=UPI0010CD13CC|nr:L-dopachrome tautomerase-related protein [Nissabacter sp. SGAir0207]QCR38317.1 bleomycin resistance protein [Nissabacter sp. SGAir0207]